MFTPSYVLMSYFFTFPSTSVHPHKESCTGKSNSSDLRAYRRANAQGRPQGLHSIRHCPYTPPLEKPLMKPDILHGSLTHHVLSVGLPWGFYVMIRFGSCAGDFSIGEVEDLSICTMMIFPTSCKRQEPCCVLFFFHPVRKASEGILLMID